jgi:hypothetical protein
VPSSLFHHAKKIEEDPYKRVEGKWIVKSTSIGGINAGEDGSYLLFNPCGGVNCEGVDIKHPTVLAVHLDTALLKDLQRHFSSSLTPPMMEVSIMESTRQPCSTITALTLKHLLFLVPSE